MFTKIVVHYKESFVTGTHGCSNRHCKIALDMISSGRIKAKSILRKTKSENINGLYSEFTEKLKEDIADGKSSGNQIRTRFPN